MFLAELLGLLSELMLSVESTGNETRRQRRHKLSGTSRFGRLKKKKASRPFENKHFGDSLVQDASLSFPFFLFYFLLSKLKTDVPKNRRHHKRCVTDVAIC